MNTAPSRARSAEARRGIQSVETGLRLLAALAAAGGPATLSALGARSGLSPSQTHRYLQSLMAAGMAVQDQAARYDLGPGVIRIGIAALARLEVFSRAEAAMQRFAAETGRTVLLSVWGETGAVCVRWLPGAPPVICGLAVGTVMPLLLSPTGHVFLSFLSPQELAEPLAAATSTTQAPAASVEAIRRRVRASLSATTEDAVYPGLRATAAPIFDLQGRPTLVAEALSTQAFSRSGDLAAAERLRGACAEATRASGGTWPITDGRIGPIEDARGDAGSAP